MMAAGWWGANVWLQPTENNLAYSISPQPAPPAPAAYLADIAVDPKAHTVAGTLRVQFVPEDEQAFFHLYANTFQKAAHVSGAQWERILGAQREPGGIDITEVRVEGERVPVQLQGETNAILHVPLTKKTAAARTEVEMQFQLRVPYNKGRMSYHDHAMWLGNWLPILAVKDADGWRLDPYSSIGDPFYSEMANYHLRVQLPDSYRLATSGPESVAVVTETRPQRHTIYEIEAKNVRDFALVVMDDTYQPTTELLGDIVVTTWSQVGDDPAVVRRLHQAAVQSLRYYSEQFGTYPYKEYDVVKTGGFFGGMEYPGIVFIQEQIFERSDSLAEAVVAHETAHQWFYGLVGNDQVREAWVDESLADYATMAFLQEKGRDRGNPYLHMRLAQSREAEAYAASGLDVWQSVERFPDWDSYVKLVYARGGAMLWQVREAWGKEKLHSCLREYVSRHQYGLASGQDVAAMLSQTARADAAPFLDYWLHLKREQADQAREWLEKGKSE